MLPDLIQGLVFEPRSWSGPEFIQELQCFTMLHVTFKDTEVVQCLSIFNLTFTLKQHNYELTTHFVLINIDYTLSNVKDDVIKRNSK